MRRFHTRRIPDFPQKLVIGTSRTKLIKPALVKSTIHFYRGATLQYLSETVLQYRPKRFNTVTLIAGHDNGLHPRHFEQKWKNLINLITNKFQPKILILPKTTQSSNNNDVSRKIYIHNHVLFNLINKFVPPHTLIVSHTTQGIQVLDFCWSWELTGSQELGIGIGSIPVLGMGIGVEFLAWIDMELTSKIGK